jgi:hypothetical protein
LAIFGETGWFGGLAMFSCPREGQENRLLLRGSLSISLVEVPVLSTSPNMAKSLKPVKSVDTIRGHTTLWIDKVIPDETVHHRGMKRYTYLYIVCTKPVVGYALAVDMSP